MSSILLKKRYWLLLTLLLTLILTLRLLPASWVIYGVQQAAPGLQVAGVSGSLWQGQVDASQWVDRGKTLPLGRLQWQLQWLSLFTLSPCADFSAVAAEQTIKGQGCYSLLSGKAVLKQTDASLPMAQIAPFFNVDLNGRVDAYIDLLTWQERLLGETAGNLLWQRAAFYNGSQWITLGDLQANATDDAKGGLTAQVKSLDTAQQPVPLAVDLNVAVSGLSKPVPEFAVKGTVAPSRQTAALNQILQLVGEPISGGGYRLDIRE